MTIQSSEEILRSDPISEFHSAVMKFKNCIVPLYLLDETGQPQLVGSSFLFCVAEEVFLCTARHVIKASEHSILFFNDEKVLEKFEGVFSSSEEHDTSLTKLTSEQVSKFKIYEPLSEGVIAFSGKTPKYDYVEIMGYPASKSGKVHKQNSIKSLMYSYGESDPEFTEYTVRIPFNKNKVISSDTGAQETAPNLRGMSGGPMFGVPMGDNAIRGNPIVKLVGINICWHESTEILGSNIAIAMAMIRDQKLASISDRINPKHLSCVPVTLDKVEP